MRKKISSLLLICMGLTVCLSPCAAAAHSGTSRLQTVSVQWEAEATEPLLAHTMTPMDASVEEFLGKVRETCALSGAEDAALTEGIPDLTGFLKRCDAAVLLWNAMKLKGEEPLPAEETAGAPWEIPDYESIPEYAREAVCQVYARGILSEVTPENGERKNVFHPGDRMTAEECDAALACLGDETLRAPHDLTDDNPYRLPDAPNGSTPMAIWLQEQGYLEGTKQTDRFRQLFFGDWRIHRFTDNETCTPYTMKVTLNVWRVNANGEKYAATTDLRVHKLLAADVYDIFQQIFEDEEQFPIYLLGCAGFGDELCHSWLAAIDINSDYNALENNALGRVVTSAGKGWWPVGTAETEWAGFLKEESIYSIPEDGSVVRAFEDYGWHWGGDWNEAYRDFMHFSILPDGG